MFIEFFMRQIASDHLQCLLNMFIFYQDILQLIVFYFYHHYFCIQYNYYSKIYLLLRFYNNFLLLFHTQKYLYSFNFFFILKRFLISLIIFSSSDLGFSIIIHYEKNKSLLYISKFQNIFFKIIHVVFNQY